MHHVLIQQINTSKKMNPYMWCNFNIEGNASIFKLISSILLSESLVNLSSAPSLAVIDMDPINRTQLTPNSWIQTMQVPLIVSLKGEVGREKVTLCLTSRECCIRSKNDMNWLKTTPFAETSLSIMMLIYLFYIQ